MASAWRLIVGDGTPRWVVLHMPPHLAHATKHPSQRIEGIDGKGYLVTFDVASPEEMASFVMRHVHEVTVIEPQALREEVLKRLHEGSRRHAAEPARAPR